MSEPSPENISRAQLDILCPLACIGGCLCNLDQRRYWYARALDAAELRGHTRAVEETAIASIHKAVAAERAAVVAWLHAEVDAALSMRMPARASTFLAAAEAIERGDHRPEEEE